MLRHFCVHHISYSIFLGLRLNRCHLLMFSRASQLIMTLLWTNATSLSWTQLWWCLHGTCGSCLLTSRWDTRRFRCCKALLDTEVQNIPPTDTLTEWFICVNFPQRGTYLPQTYIIHEEMMVTGRVRNMRQLGPFIHRLCYGKETYRLRRRSQRQREYTHPFPPIKSGVWYVGYIRYLFTSTLVRCDESCDVCCVTVISLYLWSEKCESQGIRCLDLVCRREARVTIEKTNQSLDLIWGLPCERLRQCVHSVKCSL